MDILNIEDRYILFDKTSFTIYPIAKDIADKLYKMDQKQREEIYMSLRDKEGTSVCNSTNQNKTTELRGNRLIMIVCQDCNLMCRYCYAQQGTYGEIDGKKYMTMETYKKSMEFMLTKFPEGVDRVQFFGGEPLLNVPLIKEACAWTIHLFKEKQLKPPHFTIVTNGTIITEEIIDLFNTYEFFVTISLDGNKEINDLNRIYKGNQGSVFDKIKENILKLNKKRKFNLGIEATVDKANIEQYKTNNRLIDIEEILSLQPDSLHIVPTYWENEESDKEMSMQHQIDEESFIEYFDSVSDMLFKKTIQAETQLTATLSFLNKIQSNSLKTKFCNAGSTDFAVNVEGDIYPCFVFTGIEEFKFGNVYDQKNMLNNPLENITFDDMEECGDCWASGLCNCCIGLNYFTTGDLRKPSKSACICQKTLLKRTILNCSDVFK